MTHESQHRAEQQIDAIERAALDLTEWEEEFVGNAKMRIGLGRSLTERQLGALDEIVAKYLGRGRWEQ